MRDQDEHNYPDVVDFAHQIINMQSEIEYLRRELEHYKELVAILRKGRDDSMKHTQEMVGLTFKALLDPNSLVNKGLEAVAKERTPENARYGQERL